MANPEESNYLQLLADIIQHGSKRNDRTGVGTLSLFGTQLRFSLADNKVPVLTTKKMFTRGVIEELLFFLRGETDTKRLEDKGNNIWRANTTREFLDKRGLEDLPEGDMGKSYGFQWRNFGGKIISCKYDDNKKDPMDRYCDGIDQITKALYLIKTDPDSRKNVVSAWNPKQLSEMALEPCHCMFQFYVNEGKLSLQWYQRSIDTVLGLPFNILSYAILTRLMAAASNLQPGELIFTGGDTHVYSTHVEAARKQIQREPFPFPTMIVKKDIQTVEDMEKLSFGDFEFEDYRYHPAIKVPMAV